MKEIEKIRKRNQKSPDEIKLHLRFDGKQRIISSREINRMKVQSYGKWYLKPDDFNKKVGKLSKKLDGLNKALGI